MYDYRDNIISRQRCNPGEPRVFSRLVMLRVALNHEFGSKFREFDHELAEIELELLELLNSYENIN